MWDASSARALESTTNPWGGGAVIVVSGGRPVWTPASPERDQLDRKPGLAHRQQQRQVEFLRLQLGDPAAAGDHDRDPLAEVLYPHAAAGPFFDPQLIPGNGRVADDQAALDLALRPPAKFQGACIVVKSLPLNGIGEFEAERHCLLLDRFAGHASRRTEELLDKRPLRGRHPIEADLPVGEFPEEDAVPIHSNFGFPNTTTNRTLT